MSPPGSTRPHHHNNGSSTPSPAGQSAAPAAAAAAIAATEARLSNLRFARAERCSSSSSSIADNESLGYSERQMLTALV
jgi:hypothetical protein